MASLYLRVNGIEIDSLKIRRKMISGAPIGERELVIEDPILGKFAIDDSFIIEARPDRRRKWRTSSIADLFEMIGNIPSFQL
jgi:hypothetical protein